MSLSRPIWPAQFGGFFIRIPLGLYFLLAGRLKFENLQAFVNNVKEYKVLPADLAILYGVVVPYVEVAVGVLLIIGFFTTITSVVSSLLLISYIYAVGIFPPGQSLFSKDLILLGANLSLLSIGPGLLSIDRFRQAG